MDEYKHYIRTDEIGLVIYGFTTGFEQPQAGDLLVSGQDGRHFTIQLTNERGQYLYKIVNGAMTARTQAELDEEWNARPTQPSLEERLQAAEDALTALLGL